MSSIKREKQIFFSQLSGLLRAKLPLYEALESLSKAGLLSTQPGLLSGMAFMVKEGASLSQALKSNPSCFTPYEEEIVRAGEDTGDLLGPLRWLASLNEQENEKTRGSAIRIIMLTIVTGLGIGVFFGLTLFVIPVFADMFWSFGGALPAPTQLVLSLSHLIRDSRAPLLLIGIAGLLCWLWRRRPDMLSLLLTYLPFFGRRWMSGEFIRFSLILGRSLEAGVPPLKALESSAPYVTNPYLRRRLLTMGPYIEEGRAWSTALKSIKRIPKLHIAFLKYAEEQDDLAKALLEIWQTEFSDGMGLANPTNALLIIVLFFTIISFLFILFAAYLPLFVMAGAV